jgi:hypothetical protein
MGVVQLLQQSGGQAQGTPGVAQTPANPRRSLLTVQPSTATPGMRSMHLRDSAPYCSPMDLSTPQGPATPSEGGHTRVPTSFEEFSILDTTGDDNRSDRPSAAIRTFQFGGPAPQYTGTMTGGKVANVNRLTEATLRRADSSPDHRGEPTEGASPERGRDAESTEDGDILHATPTGGRSSRQPWLTQATNEVLKSIPKWDGQPHTWENWFRQWNLAAGFVLGNADDSSRVLLLLQHFPDILRSHYQALHWNDR